MSSLTLCMVHYRGPVVLARQKPAGRHHNPAAHLSYKRSATNVRLSTQQSTLPPEISAAIATYLLRFVYTVCLLRFESRLDFITIVLHDPLLTFGD